MNLLQRIRSAAPTAAANPRHRLPAGKPRRLVAAMLLLGLSAGAAQAHTPRPTPTRSLRTRRVQTQEEPKATSPRSKSARKAPPAHPGRPSDATGAHAAPKATPHARRKHHRIEMDDPIEVKRAAHPRSSAVPHALRSAQLHSEPPAAPVREQALGAAPPVDPDELVLRPSASLPAALRPTTRTQLAEEAASPVMLPGLYRHGRLVVPAPLKGSREVLVHQNLMADNEGLERIEEDEDLDRLRAERLLIDFPVSKSLHLNPELPADRRCARPWTVKFAVDTARAFSARFHHPLQVNSAVRTVAYQLRLQQVNGNAAAVEGDTASPHLTGQAIDLGKRGMSRAELAWMRAWLLPLMRAGKIDVEEEFQQACFHISVYRGYLPPVRHRAAATNVAQLHPAPRPAAPPRWAASTDR